ncbi:energy transducer TonB [Mucilaginibacter arboris]|uniref:TonB family protein n=1 Tax=Mucilaginibacter arboris TaxID=2682090 RepID=A0A7K1SS15_9SPHI|nr:energy transducer TonB [Mucilaginibacter arboris]MVN20044.1 TonB family protein [Mucilaginibacter arboris]
MARLDILNPEWLDVVFSGRNKAYGAYVLRKENAKTSVRALIIASSLFLLAIAMPTIINKIKGFIPKADEKVKIQDVVLTPPPAVDMTKPPPPPPTVEPPKPKVDQVRFPPLVVKPDNQVPEKDPPTVKELEVKDPGQKDQKGDPSADIRIDEAVGNSDVKQAVVEENTNAIVSFAAVEKLPQFPGGEAAFGNYLSKSIRYPPVAKENNTQGRVIVSFVVEKDGSLTDIKVLRDIGGGCGPEAVRVLSKSPHWTPGIQNGKAVRVAYTMPINFTLAGDQ